MYKGWEVRGGGGWGGRGGGGGWEAEGGLHLPLGHRQWCCVSVGDRYRYNPQGRQRWPLALVWHHPHPY